LSGAHAVAKIRALVVDDEPGVRDCLRRLLESHGIAVYLAANTGEALTISRNRQEHIDLLLTGLDLKEAINGIDLAERVLQDRADIAVLVMSGTSDVQDLVAENGYSFLPKPFLSATLLGRIDELLKNHFGRSPEET
jgi:two-component system response regulator MprA